MQLARKKPEVNYDPKDDVEIRIENLRCAFPTRAAVRPSTRWST